MDKARSRFPNLIHGIDFSFLPNSQLFFGKISSFIDSQKYTRKFFRGPEKLSAIRAR